jgi:competence protein ComEC
LQLNRKIPYNQIMRHRLSKFLSNILPRALVLLLSLALLAGCAAPPSGEEAFAGYDENAAQETSVTTPIVTIPPERELEIPALPVEAILASQDFAILFVSVGKADAAILRFGETAVLIDTGSAESAPQLIAGLNALGIEQISAVFITHSHSDHLGGLDALSANYHIPMVYSAYFAEADKNGKGKIVKRAEKLNLAHTELLAGDVVPIAADVSFAVLGPLSLSKEDDNDNSLVLRLIYGGKSFLFTGDMQFNEEREVIASGVEMKSDVLKVGNHGNPDATGDDFGALVSPDFAVISTDTGVDADSANPRVYTALPSAQIVVTQNFPIGVLLTLDSTGAVSIHNPAREKAGVSVAVSDLNVSAQRVTLTNTGSSPVELSGFVLYSVRSEATLRFPNGTMLGAGETLVIGKGGDFSFAGEDKPLNKKKDNTVILYDRFGSLVSKLKE